MIVEARIYPVFIANDLAATQKLIIAEALSPLKMMF